jgi:hypothetical protein
MSQADASAECYKRALMARNLARGTTCPDTKAHLLKLEQFWLSKARRPDALAPQ